MAVSDEIIGTGVGYPLRPDARGALGYVTGAENIEQSLKLLLLTAVRERVMRNAFGSKLREMLFSPGSEQGLRLLEGSLAEAVRDWEPRVDLLSIAASADPRMPSHVIIDLSYSVRATYVRGNLVFPFYVEGSGERVA
jgi:phage baseplate assembly protein W